MITVSKSQLKARMLEHLRRVEETGEDLIVTDNRVPVIRITPIKRPVTPEIVFADVRGKVAYHADLTEPETDVWGET